MIGMFTAKNFVNIFKKKYYTQCKEYISKKSWQNYKKIPLQHSSLDNNTQIKYLIKLILLFYILVYNIFYLFNQFLQHKNIRLKKIFRLDLKVLQVIKSYIIIKFIVK